MTTVEPPIEDTLRGRLFNMRRDLCIYVFVCLQVMVNSEVSGVGFSRHPLKPLSTDHVLVEAVYGLGEGLVGGELEGDRYEVSII